MKKLTSLGLIVMSLIMFSGCDDPVDSGSSPTIISIEADSTTFAVLGKNSPLEEVNLKITVIDPDLDVKKLVFDSESNPSTDPADNPIFQTIVIIDIPPTDIVIPEMTENPFVIDLKMELAREWVGEKTIKFTAVDSMGNSSNLSQLTFNITRE